MPKETKATKAEKEFRLTVVNQMSLDGFTPKEILARVNQERVEDKPYLPKGKAWRVSLRTIQLYIAECNAVWKTAQEEERDTARVKHKARLNMLFREAKDAGDRRTALLVLKELKEIDGLAVQLHRIEHGGPGEVFDYGSLTDAELEQIIREGEGITPDPGTGSGRKESPGRSRKKRTDAPKAD